MTDRAHMPAKTSITNLVCYEDLIDANGDDFQWPVFDENTACGLCYTSGTTGNPKAALYSHRSNILHAYATCMPDVMGLSARDCALPVVPMFHANAWGLCHSGPLVGAKLVFPGCALDGKSVHELFETEKVTFSAGVPTVWIGLLQHVQQSGARFSTLRRTCVGGSAVPPAMIRAFMELGVEFFHGWGMTELSPVGSLCQLRNKHLDLPVEQQRKVLEKQGRALPGIDWRIVDGEGRELPWDGKAFGDLHVKGPWVVRDYYHGALAAPAAAPLVDGWFPTGDVATIDPDGYMQITDRSKEVIKSGGEWIGSIDLENVAMSHPAVLEGRGDRLPPSEVGRAPASDRGEEARRRGDSRGIARLVPRQSRQVVDSRRRGFRGGATAYCDREGPQDQAPGKLPWARAADCGGAGGGTIDQGIPQCPFHRSGARPPAPVGRPHPHGRHAFSTRAAGRRPCLRRGSLPPQIELAPGR
jgi:acyl-CoA synthetase (AMP-forming)/AMP-acid ligase II